MSIEHLIKAMKWLQKKSKEDKTMENVFKDFITPGFKGTDKEMDFLVKTLEEAQNLTFQLERERQLHLETLNLIASPELPKEVLAQRVRLNTTTHDSLLQCLRQENRQLQADLSTVIHHSEENQRLIREVDYVRGRLEQEKTWHNDKINKKDEEYTDIIKVLSMQLESSVAQTQLLEERLKAQPVDVDRLGELWRENQALGRQVDHFRQMAIRSQPPDTEPEPKPELKLPLRPVPQEFLDLIEKNQDLSEKLDNFVGQLIDKDDELKEIMKAKNKLEKELDAALIKIQELKMGNGLTKSDEENGWSEVDAGSGSESDSHDSNFSIVA